MKHSQLLKERPPVVISQAAKDEIKTNLQIRAAFMQNFNVAERSVTRWVDEDNITLTTLLSIHLIIINSKLTFNDIVTVK